MRSWVVPLMILVGCRPETESLLNPTPQPTLEEQAPLQEGSPHAGSSCPEPSPAPTVTMSVPGPTVTVTASPLPAPTVTVTASPLPTPTVTVTVNPGCSGNGIIACYDFSEGSGGQSADASPSGAPLSFSGAASWAVGKRGSGVSLDGLSGFLSTPHLDALNPSALSLLVWIYPQGLNSDQVLIQKYRNQQDGYQLWITPPDNRIRVAINSGSGDSSTGSVPLNTWTHVAVTYDGNWKKIYLNGSLNSSFPGNGPIAPNTEALVLGQRINQYFYKGILDQVRIYNRALDAAEITEAYQQP